MTDIMQGTEDGYAEVSVIVAGALEEELLFAPDGASLPESACWNV